MSTTDPNPPVDASSQPSTYTEGQRLAGCYVVGSRLPFEEGREVWLAEDEVLGKHVSLHFLPAAVAKDRQLFQELRQEIKRNRQLIHKSILRVYDLINEPDCVAVSMDTVDGSSAGAVLAKMGTGFDIEDVQPWVTTFAQTLEDAHKIGILHRDLAPGNLILTSAGKLVLSSFGISRTITDALLRTGAKENRHAAYTSPQVLDGQAPTKADDVYSFGAVLYALLTGKAPFVGADVPQLVRLGATTETLAPLRKPELGVPPAWTKAIAACLQKAPEARPASLAEVLQILSGEVSPSVSVPESAPGAVVEAKAPPAPPAPEKQPEAPVKPPVVEEKKPEPVAPPVVPVPVIEEKPVEEKVEAKKPEPIEEKKVEPQPEIAPPSDLKLATPSAPIVEPTPVVEPPVEQKLPEPAPIEPPVAEKIAPAPEPEPELPLDDNEPPSDESALEELRSIVEEAPLSREFVSEKTQAIPVEAKVTPLEPRKTPFGEPVAPVEEKVVPPVVETPVVKEPIAPAKPVEDFKPESIPSLAEPSEAELAQEKPHEKVESETPASEVVKPERVLAGTFSNPPRTTPAPKKFPDRGAQPPADLAPLRYPPESKWPVVPIAIAAAVVVVGVLIGSHYMGGDKTKPEAQGEPEVKELTPMTPKPATPPVITSATPAPVNPTSGIPATHAPDTVDLTDKQAALDKAKAAADAAEKTHAELLKQKQAADAAIADAQKAIDDRVKAAEPTRKAADDLLAQKKKLEDQQKAAEQAADDARKSVAAFATKNQDTLAAREKSDAEIDALRKTLADRQAAAAEAAKAIEASSAERQQQAAAVAQSAKDLETAKFTNQGSALPATPAPDSTHGQLEQELADLQKKAAQLGNTPRPGSSATTPSATPNLTTAMLTTPAPTAGATPAPTAPANGQANSLGMKFMPVGDVEFAIYEVRIKDFEAFAKVTPNLKSTAWRNPGFKQGPDHPVVNVTWQEAMAFCTWLTDKEHKDGTLLASQYYRLPTDIEWSTGVGLPPETGKTPEDRDMGIPGVYPWGTAWPPPAGAGNYTGEETSSDVAIKGYDDGFAWTSPVGSFNPNKYGLYDMGGNVWQWCMDNWNNESKAKVLRGASWYNGALKLSLLSSCRVHAAPDSSTDNYGFRIVRATNPKTPKK